MDAVTDTYECEAPHVRPGMVLRMYIGSDLEVVDVAERDDEDEVTLYCYALTEEGATMRDGNGEIVMTRSVSSKVTVYDVVRVGVDPLH